MVDPTLSLALTVQSNRGAYALLLGSGLSRAAGIPTGWEIVQNLVRKLAAIQGKDCEPAPAAWFTKEFGEEPSYSGLLSSIAKTPTERSQLLKPYFEPTEEEREQGLKVPTKAHRSIAKLVSRGYIKVIVTTNFDRLLEKALEQEGISAVVISTPDQAKGALPLVHSQCTIVKVHGDYVDTRIKNSPEELAQYDEAINLLLDRVFDEYGLIVCGWSADWDVSLRSALERCKTHRFSTFWATRSKPSEIAREVISARIAEIVEIRDADSFFEELEQKIAALEDLAEPHPLAPKVAVARLKRYVIDEKSTIRLHDLVMHETDRLVSELGAERFEIKGSRASKEELLHRVEQYNALTVTLRSLFAAGCYWGTSAHTDVWVKSLERVMNLRQSGRGLVAWLNLSRYPSLLLMYAGGLGTIASGNYRTLCALLTKPRYFEYGNETQPFLRYFNVWDVMEKRIAQMLPGMDRRHTPLSDYLCALLREPLSEYLPLDKDYDDQFDRFEYFLALAFADSNAFTLLKNWVPIGRFGWRNGESANSHVISQVDEEAKSARTSWPPLSVGFFGGSFERYEAARDRVQEFLGTRTLY